jgi:uncharacterized protein YbgA (DUF1722 family)
MDSQVTNFFSGFMQDSLNLKVLIADYNTSFINLQGMYGKLSREELQKALSDNERSALLQLLNNIRRLSFSLQTDLESLKKDLGLTEQEFNEIKETYRTFEEDVLPDYKRMKEYIQELNNIKLRHINVKALLLTQEKERTAIQSMQTPSDL